jgi:serine/threonine protein phosphatase 1
MTGRTIAIGDIHGCRQAFEALLQAIAPQPEDRLILLGDFVDRGPDSWGVVERILKLQHECNLVSLLGNHEEMLLTAISDPDTLRPWLGFGGDATVESYRLGREGLPPLTNADVPFRKWLWMLAESRNELHRFPVSHLEFLRACSAWYETRTHLFVHANCRPDVAPVEESEQFLRWEAVDPCWAKPHKSGKVMVVGHTAQKDGQVLDLGHLICIDTYCHGGGWLTALDIDTGHKWQCDLEGRVASEPIS